MVLGISFSLFLLAVALTTVGTAISIALGPTERKILAFRPLTVSTLSAIAAATAAGLATSLANAAAAPERIAPLLAGLAEAMVPPLVGFALLAVSWLLVAVGIRRRGPAPDAP
jgi:hypothetical protein